MGKKRLLVVLAAAVLLYAAGAVFSYASFRTANPAAAAGALARVLVTDAQYAQASPDVILAKPSASLDEYMEDLGYRRAPEEQMGSLAVFIGEDGRQVIHCTQNRYFSRWVRQS